MKGWEYESEQKRRKPDAEDLKKLVQKRAVYYEVWPDAVVVDGQPRRAGFEIELCGDHADGRVLSTGERAEAFRDLELIAGWVLPRDREGLEIETLPFEDVVEIDPNRNFQAAVPLQIRIRGRHDFNLPAGETERKCLSEIEHRLAQLNVPRSGFNARFFRARHPRW